MAECLSPPSPTSKSSLRQHNISSNRSLYRIIIPHISIRILCRYMYAFITQCMRAFPIINLCAVIQYNYLQPVSCGFFTFKINKASEINVMTSCTAACVSVVTATITAAAFCQTICFISYYQHKGFRTV